MRCEVWPAGAETMCLEPAHWYVESHGATGYHACERHTMEALRETSYEVTADIDGEPVCIGEDGEIARVA